MHHLMLITIGMSADATSEDTRCRTFSRLIDDDSFCGEGGRFGSPLCDWFVIGGRWREVRDRVARARRPVGVPPGETWRAGACTSALARRGGGIRDEEQRQEDGKQNRRTVCAIPRPPSYHGGTLSPATLVCIKGL